MFILLFITQVTRIINITFIVFLLRANKNPLLSIFGPSETEVDRQGAAAASQQVKALKGQTDEKLNFDE